MQSTLASTVRAVGVSATIVVPIVALAQGGGARTADGKPDLQGICSFATLTP